MTDERRIDGGEESPITAEVVQNLTDQLVAVVEELVDALLELQAPPAPRSPLVRARSALRIPRRAQR